jgi:acetyl-CoA decarbonylase/synthase complex subunit gamma
MGLSGLDIYKQLPRTNCKECGMPTCLAFAMALAAGKASLEKCPHVSDAAKEALGAAAAPPIRLVTVGSGDLKVEIGDEVVVFRHDKTFLHPTGVAVLLPDTLEDAELAARTATLDGMVLERVGLKYNVDMLAVQQSSGDAARFAAAAGIVAKNAKRPLMLITTDPAAMKDALAAVARQRMLLCGADVSNYEAMAALARDHNCPLVVKGNGLNETADLAQKLAGLGVKDIVVDTGARDTSRVLADLTQIRRLAITRRFRPLGHPTVAFVTEDDPRAAAVQAGLYIGKYASMVVVPLCEPHHLMPVLTWRGNVYTDPQKPIQVEPRVYSVGAVDRNSPVYITTNFSLTYFTVEGEVTASKVPAYILPVNTEGTSVLTSWASGKFSAESIAGFLKESGIEGLVDHRNLVLPGYVAVLSGKLQELSGWKAAVGPREAAGIPAYAKSRFTGQAAGN